jgi:uncharacterized protein (DUF2062 family)
MIRRKVEQRARYLLSLDDTSERLALAFALGVFLTLTPFLGRVVWIVREQPVYPRALLHSRLLPWRSLDRSPEWIVASSLWLASALARQLLVAVDASVAMPDADDAGFGGPRSPLRRDLLSAGALCH